jgi:hypothetical protein
MFPALIHPSIAFAVSPGLHQLTASLTAGWVPSGSISLAPKSQLLDEDSLVVLPPSAVAAWGGVPEAPLPAAPPDCPHPVAGPSCSWELLAVPFQLLPPLAPMAVFQSLPPCTTSTTSPSCRGQQQQQGLKGAGLRRRG